MRAQKNYQKKLWTTQTYSIHTSEFKTAVDALWRYGRQKN